jgi:FAD synthase
LISLISPSEVKNPTSIAIGSFDGLHAGHRQLIKSVVEENPEKFFIKRLVLDLISLMKNYLFLKI